LPELLASLEERYGVRIEEEQRSAEDVFTEAQRAANPREAVALFEEVVERWPESERVPEALFMIGFKRSEELHDSAGAQAAFGQLLERFPDSELAQSARWMLSSGADGVPEFEAGETASPEESAP
jgi:outer membrane protein assembly factor BamD (BamD/ComL family)